MLCHIELSRAWANRAFRQGELSSLLSSKYMSNPFEVISLFIDCETGHWNSVLWVYLGRLTWIHRGLFFCYLCKCCTQGKGAGSVLSLLFIHFITSVKNNAVDQRTANVASDSKLVPVTSNQVWPRNLLVSYLWTVALWAYNGNFTLFYYINVTFSCFLCVLD